MERQYDYRPKWMVILLCGLFFGACALVLAGKANGNDRGLIIIASCAANESFGGVQHLNAYE